MRIRDILLEYDRNLEIKKHESKLLKAIKNDDFFFKKVKNLDDDKKVNVLYDQLESIDPTPNHKYIKWLVQNYIKGKFRIEDAERVREALSEFDKLKPRLKNYGKSPDINQYDLHSLEDMIEKLQGSSTKGETDFHKRFKELNPNEYKILYDGPYGILVTPKTSEASRVLGRGTKWCTTIKDDFNEYNEQGPLYIWKDNTGTYQFHFETQQFMDAMDRPIPPEKLQEMRKKNPALKKFFNIILKKFLDKNPEPMAIAIMADLLFKNERWPEAEKHILKNPDAISHYMIKRFKGRWPEAEPYIIKGEGVASDYAYRYIKGRWPEAEPYIMKSPISAYSYAKYVLKRKRWPEAEPYIMKDPVWAYYYAYDVMNKKRWPEAEPYIMKDPLWACRYAQNIIGSRWPEAEPYIKKDKECWEKYKRHFNIKS